MIIPSQNRRVIPLIIQAHHISRRWPTFKIQTHRASKFVWRGTLQPTPISDTYEIEIVLQHCVKPTIKVLSPKLDLAKGAKKLPHVFAGDYLCLHYPRFQEWTSARQIADTIIPWTSLWLLHYENWLFTGEWAGGGKHPSAGGIHE